VDQRRRTLVVEDDAGVADVVRYRLGRCGFAADDVRVAGNAVAAMHALDTEVFALVLLDQRLPQSERDLSPRDEVGREVLRYCRRRCPAVPVIMMTAFAGRTVEQASDTTAQLMKLGARDFIVKPFEQSREPFEDKVRAALEGVDSATAKPVPVGEACREEPPTFERKHLVQFVTDALVSIDGVEVSGGIVPVLRELLKQFLEDQKAEPGRCKLQGIKGVVLADAVGVKDEATIRRRVANFRKKFAADYLAHHGRAIDAQASIENPQRAGYRLNPRTVALVAAE